MSPAFGYIVTRSRISTMYSLGSKSTGIATIQVLWVPEPVVFEGFPP